METLHRHHSPVVGHKFSIGVADDDKMVGAVCVGRPVSRHLDDGWTLEVNRCVTDGTKKCMQRYMGPRGVRQRRLWHRRLITYTLPEEGDASLRAWRDGR